MDIEARLVPLEGSCNFRDLGGYPGHDGRATRWGRLFRADGLHDLTVDDVARLRDLGLRTVVDLRTERELDRTGRGLLGSEGVAFHHLAVIKEGVRADGSSDRAADGESVAAPDPAGDDLSERYLWYLDVGRGPLVEALTLLGGHDRYPLVFHCAAGKDRTGVLAALILDIVGVDRETIVADYVLTAERILVLIDRWKAADPKFAERMVTLPPSRFGVVATTMERFLDGLRSRHGGAHAWALEAGVPAESLDTMIENLLEPPV